MGVFSKWSSLLQRNLPYRTYLSSLQLMLCRVAVIKSIPVHHYNADYMFWYFGIIVFILSYFENRIPVVDWVIIKNIQQLDKDNEPYVFDICPGTMSSYKCYFDDGGRTRNAEMKGEYSLITLTQSSTGDAYDIEKIKKKTHNILTKLPAYLISPNIVSIRSRYCRDSVDSLILKKRV